MSAEHTSSRSSSPGRTFRQPKIPSRSSSISRTKSSDRVKSLDQADSTVASGKDLLPQLAEPPSTSRHQLLASDGISPYCLESTCDQKSIEQNRHRPSAHGFTASKVNRRSASCSSTRRSTMHPAKVQRWAGLTRTVSDWDVLRRVCGLCMYIWLS